MLFCIHVKPHERKMLLFIFVIFTNCNMQKIKNFNQQAILRTLKPVRIQQLRRLLHKFE